MRRRVISAVLLSTVMLPAVHGGEAAADRLCKRWSTPTEAGRLEVATVMEASGLAVSGDGSRLFHVNDGSAPVFFVSDLAGGALRTVRVSNFAPTDLEDLARGRCGNDTCLYLADTGDNAARRTHVQIALVRELDRFGDEVTPVRVIEAQFPDAPRDVEAMAVHPSGDLLFVTKRPPGIGGPALLFRLKAAQLEAGGRQTLELLGLIPVASLAASGLEPLRVVTSMDISPDGTRLMLLTYATAVEMVLDLAHPVPEEWQEGSTHRGIAIAPLTQAEAIAYTGNGRSIIYSTESVRGSAAPLMRQDCLE